MESSKRKLEAQRAELVSRLQELLRSHWTEALRLLANQNQVWGGRVLQDNYHSSWVKVLNQC